jgi:hypothetical protein
MLLNIAFETVWSYQALNQTYFHPRACSLPHSKGAILMIVQTISGSDFFGPVQFSCSSNSGRNWQPSKFVPNMGPVPISNGVEEGVCDVVPDYHPPTGTVLAVGHNVFYRDGRLYDSLGTWHKEDGPVLQRYIVYTVMNKQGKWSGIRKRLEVPEFADSSIFSCGCSQKVVLADGNILIPVTFGYFDRKDRLVTSLLCGFDGNILTVLEHGNILELPVDRGLLEPSIIEFQGVYYLTIRAEDDRGYLSVSDDGLNWGAIKAWQWEDGTPLIMSTTQQHWLKLGGKLYLVYTRKNGQNGKVMRWRAPLLMAEFDPENLCLRKSSEQTVLPMRGNGQQPETVGLMGNFHPLAISDSEAIVTVGEMRPQMGFTGDTLLARITV